MFTKAFKSMSAAKQIAFLAMAVAVSVAVNFLSIDISPSNKITFTYFISFFCGFLFGPVPAFLIGLLGDFIGWLIVPSGIYWLFGVTLGLFGALSAWIMNFHSENDTLKRLYVKTAIASVVCYVAITCVLNSIVGYSYVYIFIWEGVAKKAFWIWLGGRLGFQTIMYAINTAICFLILPVAVKLKERLH